MSESVDWAGLSSRLSAYSLSSADAARETPGAGDADPPADAQPPDDDDAGEADTADGTDA